MIYDNLIFTPIFFFFLGLCEDCMADLEFQEASYYGAKMYVYKVTNEVDEESLAQAEAAEAEVKSN